MTNPNHHILDPHSEEDNDSEKNLAAQHVTGLEEPLNTLNDTHEVKALPRRAPEDLVFTSTTIAPSPPPPIVCAPSNSRATLSSLNTTQQRHSGASSSDSSPVSATRLRVQRGFTSRPTELEASDSNYERRGASKAIPIARTPSIKQVLASSFGSNSYSGSAPNSALSSPQLNAMPDLTPLPSPILSNGSPGPWRRRISKSEHNESRTAPLTGDTALVTPSGELIPSAIANESKRRAYHGLLLNSPEDITFKPSTYKIEKQGTAHSRNRSLSEYTPDPQTPRKRQQSVSGTYPKDMLPDRAPPVESHMRREPHLALQRGIAPVPRPPTPPCSRTGGESSESDSAASHAAKPIVKDYKKRSKHIYFDAVTIANKKRRWRALKLLGEGTFSKVMLATSQLEKDSDTVDEDEVSLPDDGATEIALTEADTSKLVAVKICEHGPKGGASEERVEISLKRELELMKSIHHPSLVELQAWSLEESRAILVLGYCPGGDLFEVASQHSSILVPSLLQRIFAEIVFAIQYLHERHIVHRDIKLESK